jgi:hypothetical protein
MGMSMGMIGAIGGVGKGLSNESEYIAKQEEADATAKRQKDYQGWLMAQQDQYAVAKEGRAEQAEVRKDERTWTNEQTRAPIKRGIKVEDEKAAARGKSEVAGETLETDARVTSTLAEAKQTEADKKLKGSQSNAQDANAEYTRGAKTALSDSKADGSGSGNGKAPKMDQVDADELAGVRGLIGKKSELIDKARAEGTWNPATNPGQKSLQSEMVGLQLRERAIRSKYREGDPGGTPDPLGMRPKPAGAEGAPRPKAGGMIQAGDGDRAMILNQEMAKARQQLTSAQTDVERTRAQNDINALTREMRAAGVQVADAGAAPQAAATPKPPTAVAPIVPAAAPAAAAPAAKPALAVAAVDPTEVLGREVDASRSEYKALTEPSKRPGLAAGGKAREEYAAKVATLRQKLQMQEKRYADAVGSKGAAFAVARP